MKMNFRRSMPVTMNTFFKIFKKEKLKEITRIMFIDKLIRVEYK